MGPTGLASKEEVAPIVVCSGPTILEEKKSEGLLPEGWKQQHGAEVLLHPEGRDSVDGMQTKYFRDTSKKEGGSTGDQQKMDKYFKMISNFAKTKKRTREVEMEEAGRTDDRTYDKRTRRDDKKEKEDLDREAVGEMDLMGAGKQKMQGGNID